MINAAELRIWNWLRVKVTDNVTGDSNEKDVQWGIGLWGMYINPSSTLYNQEFNYTPLTEEWLVRFGFEKEPFVASDYGGYLDKAIIYSHNLLKRGIYLPLKGANRFEYELANYMGGGDYCTQIYETVTIEYVHQLQNLVFALEGVELEITKINKSI